MIKYTCQICGKEILGYPSKKRVTCSTECRDIKRHRDKLVEKECPICGKKFSHIRSKADRTTYCSPKCRGYARMKREYKCHWCGKVIDYKPCAARKMKYCSRKCFGEATTAKHSITCACEFCGKEFTKRTSDSKRFCSQLCAARGTAVEKFGYSIDEQRKLSKNQNSHQSATKLAKKILGDKCAICGWEEETCDVHHIKPRSESGSHSLTNLIVVCPNHHRLIRNHKISDDEVWHIWQERYGTIKLPY